MAKKYGYNLLAFVYFPLQTRGVTKVVLKKSTCKMIIKIIKKTKGEKSDKVKVLAMLLNSNIVTKFSVATPEVVIPNELTEDLCFIFVDNFAFFKEWTKKSKNGLVLTAIKIQGSESSDWHGDDIMFRSELSEFSYKNQEFALNTIIFNNGINYTQNEVIYNFPGRAKIILTLKMWKKINFSVVEVSNSLKNEKDFCYISLEPNSTKILSYAFEQFASAIYYNSKFIDEAFIKFPQGLILHFEAIAPEKFKFKQISGMPLIFEFKY